MIKSMIQHIIKLSGYELCRFSRFERDEASCLGWNIDSMNYKEFQVARTLAAEGHISLEEAQFLASLVRSTDPEDPIIEIGTLFGFSTLVLAMNKQKKQKLITVDKYIWNPLGISPKTHQLATQAVLKDACIHHNVEIIVQDKDEFYKSYSGPKPGIFFCDANHDYEPTLHDLKWAQEIGAKIICGHDYNLPSVSQAVNELGGPKNLAGNMFVL